jgi:hypothetical protein
MHPDGHVEGVTRGRGLTPNARRALWRLGVSWAVLLVFVIVALAAHSRTVLLIGVVASVASSVAMRIVGR